MQGTITFSSTYHAEGPSSWTVYANATLVNFDNSSVLTADQIVSLIKSISPSAGLTYSASGSIGNQSLLDITAVRAWLNQNPYKSWSGSGAARNVKSETLVNPDVVNPGTWQETTVYNIYTITDNTVTGNLTLS